MSADDIRKALCRKLRLRWNEYSAEVVQHSSAEVFERADEIAAARFCYDQLTENVKSYPAEYLEYLLRFEDPLSVVQDQWASHQNVDHSDEFEHALWTLWNTHDAEQDYPLDPDWSAEQCGPAMC